MVSVPQDRQGVAACIPRAAPAAARCTLRQDRRARKLRSLNMLSKHLRSIPEHLCSWSASREALARLAWAVSVQQRVAPPADDGVLAVEGGLVVGAVVAAGDEQARVLRRRQDWLPRGPGYWSAAEQGMRTVLHLLEMEF